MNVYTFETKAGDDLAFFDWLQVNVGKRYRIIRLTRPARPFRRRGYRKKVFHSQVKCRRKYREGGWAACHYSAVCFTPKRQFSSRVADDELPRLFKKRSFSTRYRNSKAFDTLYFRRRFPEIVTISILFDSAADMILCKMRWHDERRK